MISLGSRLIACCKLAPTLARQMRRHNYAIDRNEYLISTLSESTLRYIHCQFLFKSAHQSCRYERKCEWVFFSEHGVDLVASWVITVIMHEWRRTSVYLTTCTSHWEFVSEWWWERERERERERSGADILDEMRRCRDVNVMWIIRGWTLVIVVVCRLTLVKYLRRVVRVSL